MTKKLCFVTGSFLGRYKLFVEGVGMENPSVMSTARVPAVPMNHQTRCICTSVRSA